LTKNQTPIL